MIALIAITISCVFGIAAVFVLGKQNISNTKADTFLKRQMAARANAETQRLHADRIAKKRYPARERISDRLAR